MEPFIVLVINPGSTSTKLALYENETQIDKHQINYTRDQITQFNKMADQFEMRLAGVEEYLDKMPVPKEKLSALACRGGVIVPVKAGAYRVNERMVDRLRHRPLAQHASNLGGMIGLELEKQLGIPAYVYDGVSVNEMAPLGYATGVKGVIRQTRIHCLNTRAMLRKTAEVMGRDQRDINVVMAHIGGGITMAVFEKGRMIDALMDCEGPFTPERGGRTPLHALIYFCLQEGIPMEKLVKTVRGGAGMAGLLGTNDTLEVENRALNGDKFATYVYEAMAYQVAKGIGELATVLKGKVDKIVLTGAIARSRMFTDWVIDRVSFIADVLLLPGEDEMGSLNAGILRVLRGEEAAHTFTQEEDDWEHTFRLEDVLEEYEPTVFA